MSHEKKIGIVVDEDFATNHIPPAPTPVFIAFENPLRVKVILEYFNRIKMFENPSIIKLSANSVPESIIKLAHSDYHISTIKKISAKGGGFIGEEVFITEDTFELAKKAVGGTIEAVEKVLKGDLTQSIALVRPPGHHAIREKPSGLCVFNNIAVCIKYLRKQQNFKEKIAIIDIDDHFGDGLCQYFYEDPSVLYCSTHEFDFTEGDVGDIDEIGEDKGEGTTINFPVPAGLSDGSFLEFMDIVEPIVKEYQPSLIIVATGFDMYFDDPIGNCCLTSISYYNFTQKLLKLAEEVCGGKIAFILEGGYSLSGLPFCVTSIIRALLGQEYKRPEHEILEFKDNLKPFIKKTHVALKKILAKYWKCMKKIEK